MRGEDKDKPQNEKRRREELIDGILLKQIPLSRHKNLFYMTLRNAIIIKW